MASNQRVNSVVVIVLLAAYVLAFIPANRTGAQNANMLAAFQIDEWLQFPHVMRMTTAGATPADTLRNVFVYQHYFYGYPFYVTSALTILPVRAATAFAPLEATTGDTPTLLLLLRQLSPLLMVMAAGLLVYAWTSFAHLGRTLLVLALVLTAPAVFDNNLWWHAESLTVLMVALTIFALFRDDLRFGRWYVVAAVACGLAAGTKQAGFWFFLAVPVYIALAARRDGWQSSLRRGVLFAGLMALTIVATNPLLLIPAYARQILDTQLLQADRIAFGWDVAMARGPVPWYRETLRLTYGFWWVYVLAVGSCVWAILDGGRSRLLAIVTLTYVIPFSLYLLFFVAAKPARYFLPIMVPLLAALGYEALYQWDRRRPARLLLSIAVVAAVVVQIGVFLQRDVTTYQTVLTRERLSPALSFNAQLQQAYFAARPPDEAVVIYRDPSVYVAPRPNTEIVVDWALPSVDLINALQPDLILLQQSNIARYTDPAFVANHFRPEHAQRNADFYAAAVADAVPGYEVLLQTDFGLALVREGDG